MKFRRRCTAFVLGLVLMARTALPAIASEPEFVIRIKDHKFIPAQLGIPAGTKVRIILENQGETPEEFDSHALNREKHVPARSRVTLFIGPLEAGRYLFEGESGEHPGGAALGVLVVQ